MDIGSYLRQATNRLTEAGVDTARLDVLILLEDLLGKDRALILAHTDDLLTREQQHALDALVQRRSTHEPLAYIRSHAAFYGRDFAVSPAVLVPRPETETIIELIKTLPINPAWSIADIGTGSGAIGLTVALETQAKQVDLYDISPEALTVAKHNLQLLKPATIVNLYISDLLASLRHDYNVILANLPYVPTEYPINRAARHEPGLALFADADGLRDYRTFWQQVSVLKYKPTYIITESFPAQHALLATLAKAAGYTLDKTDDFIQLFKKVS